MKCEEVQEKLSLYIDGMLSGEETTRIREHLLLCPACNREYLVLSEVTELLHHMPQPELPGDFDRNFRKALEKERQPRAKVLHFPQRASSFKKYVSAAAVLFLLVACVPAALLSQRETDISEHVDTTEFLEQQEDSVLADAQNPSLKENLSASDADGGMEGGEAAKAAAGQSQTASGESGEKESVQTEKRAASNSQSGDDNVAAGQIQSNSGQKSVSESSSEAASQAAAQAEAGEGRIFTAPTLSEPEIVSSENTADSAQSSVQAESAQPAEGENSSVMEAAYSAGAKTYNEALDFVSLIADNNKEGLCEWLLKHFPSEISSEKASELAEYYMETYKANTQ